MKRELQQMIEQIYKQYLNKKRWHKVVMALAVLIVFCTTYALVLPAITIETKCGIEEHSHEAVCYANEDMNGLLICELDEHTHEESCYQKEEAEEIAAINETEVPAEEVVEEIVEEETSVEEEILEEETSVEEEILGEETPAEETTEEIVEEDTENSESVSDVENSEESETDIETIESETLVLEGVITTDEDDEITWELIPNSDESYTLKVSGNGVIPDDFVRNVPELAKEVENDSIKALIISKEIISIGQNAFSEMDSLESIEVEEESVLEGIDDCAFQDCPNLIDFKNMESVTWLGKSVFSNSLNNTKQFNYTTNTFPALAGVDTGVFEGNKFEELTIGSLPLNNRMFGKSSALKVVTFETKFDQALNLFADSSSRFKTVIGAEVDEFYAANLKSISPYTDSLHFEGPNYLKISAGTGSGTGFSEPLNDLNGNYYADEDGVLYQLNDDDTAILAYCPPGLEKYEAFTQIPKEDGTGNYTVSSIDEHALVLAADLVSLKEEITKAEDELVEINHKKDIMYLAGSSKGSELLNNETATKESLSYSVDTGIIGEFTITTSDDGSLGGTDGFTYYTGIMNQTTVKISTAGMTDVENKVFRLYMIASDPRLEFDHKTLSDGETVKLGDITYKRNNLDNGYYIDLPILSEGDTLSLDLKFNYPSPNTPGGTVYLWGAILDKDAAQNEATRFENAKKVEPPTAAYHKMTWITSEDQFDVEKTAGTSAKLRPSADGNAVVSDLIFMIQTVRTNADTQVQNKGENFVDNFEFVDTMTLPEELSWREGVTDAINAYKCENNKIIVTLGGKKYILAECLLDDEDFAIETKSVAIGNNGELQIRFIVKNMKIDSYGNLTETDVPVIQLNIGNDILIADLKKLENKATVQVTNHITMTPHYNFPKDAAAKHDEATADVSIREGAVTLTKSHDRESQNVYWGENVNYTVTMKNETVYQAPSYGKLVDSLNENTYISAENLQKMFTEDTMNKLSVQITNATLYQISEKRTAVDVNGDPVNSLTPQNTGVDVVYNGLFSRLDTEHMVSKGTATITFQWSGEGEKKTLTMLVDDSVNNALNCSYNIGSSEYPTIKAALDSIGYTITSQAASRYTCTWDVKDVALNPGESKSYVIPATIKNTFMLLGRDLTEYHYQFAGGCEFINNAVLQDESDKVVEQVATKSQKASYELRLGKSASSAGKELKSGFKLSEGAVLDYSLSIEHRGKSQYDVLPVVDHMQGGNVLLAKVSENEDAEWVIKDAEGKTLAPVIVNIGEEQEPYYVLTQDTYNQGIYNRVKFGEYLASDVIVNNTQNGLDTIIHWYFSDTPDKAYKEIISYKALVSREHTGTTSTNFSINNEVWLNDHQSHRLYAALFGTGSILVADKKIVTKSGEREVYSLLDESDSEVKYELTLKNVGFTELSISGSNMYDALPNTFDSFEWKKGTNVVSIEYSPDAMIVGGDEWTIKNVSPANGTKTNGQYYICWKDSFVATIPAGQTLTITVKLKFPTGDGWGEFFKACNGDMLLNSFYVYHMSTQVSHNLRGVSSAKLQKGVYDVGTMAYSMTHANQRGKPYVSTGTRHLQSNLTSRSDIVTYYVCILNDGTNLLYLNDLIDTSSGSARPLNLCSFADIGIPNGIGNPGHLRDTSEYTVTLTCVTENSVNNAENPPTMLSSIEAGDVPIRYLNTTVNAKYTKKGLIFTFSGGDLDNTHYDSEIKKYFLRPNEAIRFGYSVNTGFASSSTNNGYDGESQEMNVNTIMMPYTDITGLGLKISDLEIKASDLNGLNPNDGDCKIISDAEAAAYGNVRTDGDKHDQWLASEVTIKKGEMLPGIRKTAVKPDESNESDELNASHEDPLKWEIYAYNDGTAELNDYIISDEIEWPYRFLGDVTYEVYNRPGEGPQPAIKAGTNSYSKLFSIESNTMGENENEMVVLKDYLGNEYKLNSGNNFTAEVRCACLIWYGDDISTEYRQNTLAVRVSFEITENGNQRINIQFLGHTSPSIDLPSSTTTLYRIYWGLPAGGYGKLNISAENKTGEYINKPFNNFAWLTPVGEDRAFSPTPVHGNATSLNINGVTYPSVVSDATINVSSGFFTSAEKRVTEIDGTNASNTATSTSKPNNFIFINEKSSTFRYDLEVTTPKEIAPTKFVLIDSLPGVGDFKTFSSTVPRYSEFDVSFTEDPIVSVKIIDKTNAEHVLDANQYQIGYSKSTTFTSADWDGTSSWSSDLTRFKEDGKITARSVRLLINDPSVLKEDSKIILSFNAVINDADASDEQIAWNSFGYQYEVTEPDKEPEIFRAAPLPVGIKFPAAPTLLKKLKDQNGNFYTTEKDVEFKFLIYKGDSVKALESINYSSEGSVDRIRTILSDNNISQYFLQDVRLSAGYSSSDNYILKPDVWYSHENNLWIEKHADAQGWKWENNAQYTLVELPTDNKEYEIDSIINDANKISTTRSYPFIYHADKKENITAINKYRTWELILSKADSEDTTRLLADAVFALYSPNPDDAELHSSETSDADIAALKNTMGISNVGVAKQVQVGDANYYLKDIIQIGNTGTYSRNDLVEENYVLQELRAPNGYILYNRPHVVLREADYHVEYTITNVAGYMLPDSGGMGISGITIGGAALMLTATAGFLENHRRTSKRRKKGQ